MILTEEQIDQLDLAACQQALEQMEQDHRLDIFYSELTELERSQTDRIANTLLWLEDRIRSFQVTEQAQQANASRWANHTPRPRVEPSGPKRKKFRIGDQVYPDVQTAALKLGLKLGTLRAYAGRNPEMYGYVD